VGEGLIQRTRGSGTFVLGSPSIKQKPTLTVALIMTYVDDYIFPRMIAAVEQTLRCSGYTMQLMITHNRIDLERAAILTILGGGVDAVIAEPVKSALPNMNASLYQELISRHLPLLFINAWYPGLVCPHVVVDDQMGGRLAAEYLAGKGHKIIGAVFKADDLQGHQRYQGFCAGLISGGLTYNDDTIIWYTTEELDDLFAGNHDDYFLKRFSGCTGLVCYNDQIALRLISLFKRHVILCPADCSIISFDDSNLAGPMALNLTSISHPKELLGEQAAARILKLLDSPCEDVTLSFEPHLIERGSVNSL
jgi:GntR family transcriptional regulator of arabinose operon